MFRILESAGYAIKALTGPMSAAQSDLSRQSLELEHNKESFSAAASSYFTILSSLDVRLRRQIYALEEAEILNSTDVPPEEVSMRGFDTKDVSTIVGSAGTHVQASKPKSGLKSRSLDGGQSSLDVGWLNSRNNHVGKEMEAEIWVRIIRILRIQFYLEVLKFRFRTSLHRLCQYTLEHCETNSISRI